jgi:hypothetical protein
MSDLSQSHLKSAALVDGSLPLSARPRKAGDTPFSWPTPPFAAYALPEPQREPLACEIEGRTGNLMTGQLVALEVGAGIARVQVPPERVSLPMRFDQIRRITLQAPAVPLNRQTAPAPAAGAPAEAPSEEHTQVLEHHAA